MGRVRAIRASAGSGKTFRLALEYLCSVILEPYSYRHILAVTFTNKATEEMKRRILDEINRLATGRPGGYADKIAERTGYSAEKIRRRASEAQTLILHDYSRFAIMTIDKFFQRIIRSFIRELGLDLRFNLELKTDTLLNEAADGIIAGISENDDLRAWLADFVSQRIEQGKHYDIRRELAALGSEIFKESYSGGLQASKEQLGKIVGDIESRSREINSLLLSKAKSIMELAGQAGLVAEDFLFGRQGFMGYVERTASGSIAPYGRRVEDARHDPDKWVPKGRPESCGSVVQQGQPLLNELCTIYDENLRFLNSASLLIGNYRSFALLADMAANIERLCAERNILPISETNRILHRLVSGNDAPFIYEKSGNRFTHFFIDEFQDTSLVQWQNFIPLLDNALAQSDGSPVLVVGDVKQSIYRWRGGDWKILAERIDSRFGESIRENLDTNYRSCGNIVRFNNELIALCVGRENKHINGMLSASEGLLSESFIREHTDIFKRAYDTLEQKPARDNGSGHIGITLYDSDKEAPRGGEPPIIEAIDRLHREGYANSEIAILVRYNREAVRIAEMLLEHKKELPAPSGDYDIITQEALTIGSSSAVRFITAIFKLACNDSDAIALAIYNHRLQRLFDDRPSPEEKEFMEAVRRLPLVEALERVISEYALGKDERNAAYIQAFYDQILSFSSDTAADIPLFTSWWEEKGCGESVNMSRSSSAITVTTIHKAKGLQYKAVILPFCSWSLAPGPRTVIWAETGRAPCSALGRVPLRYRAEGLNSCYAESYTEEYILSHIDAVNALYVALTRAEEALHIMIPSGAIPAKEAEAKNVGSLIMSAMNRERIQCVSSSPEAGEQYESGDYCRRAAEEKKDGNPLRIPICSFDPSPKTRLRFRNERYYPDEALSPRSMGVLLHRLFEFSENPGDIQQRLERLAANGDISHEERERLDAMVGRAFADPRVASWFDGSWSLVRNESNIILPGGAGVKRPDRVMISGDRVAVVEYKFGQKADPQHRNQVEEYIGLMRGMGYREAEGYLWYVSMGEVVGVRAC